MTTRLAALLLLAARGGASTPASNGPGNIGRVLMEADMAHITLPPVDSGWRGQRSATRSDAVNLVVVIRRAKGTLATLENALWEVSDPTSPRYGLYPRLAQLRNLSAPPPDATTRVEAWLLRDGGARLTVRRTSGAGDLLRVATDADTAARLFATRMSVYHHSAHPELPPIVRAATPYSLPADIAALVELVGDLRHFPTPRSVLSAPQPHLPAAEAAGPAWPKDCGACGQSPFLGKRVTPAVLAEAYQLSAPVAPGVAKGSMAIAEFTQVFWDQHDLDIFAKDCKLENVTIDHQIGVNKPLQCKATGIIRPNLCKEALLDITTIKGVAGSIPLTNVYSPTYSILDWASKLDSLPEGELPLVQSVSYGNDEAQQTSSSYMLAVNVELQKLGLRGATVLFASGDKGVSGRAGSPRRFHPGFPTTSPFVTSVGGTDFA
eukprot:COSAG05_NODE_3246_length_2211_cov_2.136837_2_plen_435_part_00